MLVVAFVRLSSNQIDAESCKERKIFNKKNEKLWIIYDKPIEQATFDTSKPKKSTWKRVRYFQVSWCQLKKPCLQQIELKMKYCLTHSKQI